MNTKTPTRPLVVGIYTRTTNRKNRKQAQRDIETQRATCTEFLWDHSSPKLRVSSARYDDTMNDVPWMPRPALMRLLKHVREKRVDIVIVQRINRLSCHANELRLLLREIDSYGGGVVSLDGATSPLTAMLMHVALSICNDIKAKRPNTVVRPAYLN